MNNYRQVLENIANPIAYLRKLAEDEGAQLNGIYAQEFAKDGYQLSKMAQDALNNDQVDGWISVWNRLPGADDLTNGAIWAWNRQTGFAAKVNHMFVKKDSPYSHWMRIPLPPSPTTENK